MKKKEEKLEYWKCLIGPVNRNDLPSGSDFPMRQAVGEAFHSLTSHYANTCASGWGVSQEKCDEIRSIWSSEDKIFTKHEMEMAFEAGKQSERESIDSNIKEGIIGRDGFYFGEWYELNYLKK